MNGARKPSAGERRRLAEKRGRLAEHLVAARYLVAGFRILEKRYKSGIGEVDLIGRRGNLYVFVEVKARANLADGVEAVTPRARRRIEHAAQQYLAGATDTQREEAGVRFDIAVVQNGGPLGRKVSRITDAWREGE